MTRVLVAREKPKKARNPQYSNVSGKKSLFRDNYFCITVQAAAPPSTIRYVPVQ